MFGWLKRKEVEVEPKPHFEVKEQEKDKLSYERQEANISEPVNLICKALRDRPNSFYLQYSDENTLTVKDKQTGLKLVATDISYAVSLYLKDDTGWYSHETVIKRRIKTEFQLNGTESVKLSYYCQQAYIDKRERVLGKRNERRRNKYIKLYI